VKHIQKKQQHSDFDISQLAATTSDRTMSVQFTQNPQQVVHIVRDEDDDDGQQRLTGPRVPLERMTSRFDQNPYGDVQEQLKQVHEGSREERAERIRIRRIFEKASLKIVLSTRHESLSCVVWMMMMTNFHLPLLVRQKP